MGKLYGIGVGPGDPELLTLKAVRTIRECDCIAVPGVRKEESAAYKIVLGAVPEIAKMQCLEIEMPMTKDKQQLEACHKRGTQMLMDILEQDKSIAFLTLGDSTIYSTYMYLHQQIQKMGYETELIPGIPSFCAAAARLGISLGEKDQKIHIIPSSYEVEEAAKLSGNKIFMKAGSKIGYLKEVLNKAPGDVYMVENCTMENEHIFYGAENMPEDAGYYSIVIMKNREEN